MQNGIYTLELLKKARATINSVANENVLRQAQLLVDTIEESFTVSHILEGISVALLPPLQAFITEEETLLMEWIMPSCRLGFSIDPNQEESSWYLITDTTLGDIAASGFLHPTMLKPLVNWLLTFLTVPLQPV